MQGRVLMLVLAALAPAACAREAPVVASAPASVDAVAYGEPPARAASSAGRRQMEGDDELAHPVGEIDALLRRAGVDLEDLAVGAPHAPPQASSMSVWPKSSPIAKSGSPAMRAAA